MIATAGLPVAIARALRRLPDGEIQIEVPGRGVFGTTRRLNTCDEIALEDAIAQRGEVLVVMADQSPILAGVLVSTTPEDTVRDRYLSARRLRFDVEEEFAVRCGPTSIVMRKNGRVLIRGNSVDMGSRGTLRLRGGAVKIN